MGEPSNTILHYRTGVHGRVAAVSSLSAGMLAVNYYDGKIQTLQVQGSVTEVVDFLPAKCLPYVLNSATSSINVNVDSNIVSGYFSSIGGGYGNVVSGSGSMIASGENNTADGDLSFVTGINNHTKGYSNTFLLGSSLSAIQTNTTYVNNLSSQDKLYGTLLDWMTLVRGYKSVPTLSATLASGKVYSYLYASQPSDKAYYRFIATDGSEDSFYASFDGTSLSNIVAKKAITL
jgi:hypothetical protein